VFNIYCRQIA